MNWQVLRQSGRRNTKVRTVIATSDEQTARARFEAEKTKMRQGVVEFVQDATLIDRVIAYRTRTRW